MDVIASYFNAVNLPATLLLGLVVCYWALVIFGLFDIGVFDFDWSADPPSAADAGPDLGSAAVGAGGTLKAMLGFFYLGRVPTMMLMSIFALIFWLVNVCGNQFWNPDASLTRMGILWIPFMFGSLLITKLIFWPMLPFFDEQNRRHGAVENTLIGKQGTVCTSEVTESFGQIEITQQGPSIVINARAGAMDRFVKGDVVKILSHDTENNTYLIASIGEKK